MLPDPGTIVTIVGMAIAGIVWAIRLEGRQTSHERECIQYRKLVDERHVDMKADITEVKDDVKAMNGKLDTVIARVK